MDLTSAWILFCQAFVETAAMSDSSAEGDLLDRNEVEKLVKRHARFSGGVQAKWLAQEAKMKLAQMENIMQALGFRAVSEHWFLPENRSHDSDVFCQTLNKMLHYCGPLPVDEICSGIRRAVSRTNFPVPPPDVMEQILQAYGYQGEQGRYVGGDGTEKALSKGESVIMNCLKQSGPVVHYSILASAFIASELPFSALRTTLSRTPLFERVGTGLYKLRGESVTRQDIERAENTAERISIDLEINYDKTGKIITYATLNTLSLGTGVISSKQLPNLSGEWDCFVQGQLLGKLEATTDSFRRLELPFEFLGCQVGDRIKFTFNTWDRSVTIKKASALN